MTKVKVLSLLQPWATLVVLGAKTIETRSWDTKHRGQLLIHASKKFTREQAKLCKTWPFDCYINNLEDIELGYIIGAVDVWKTTSAQEALYNLRCSETERSQEEFRFGDYSDGRFCWYLRDAIEFNEMIPAKGKLGLWDFEIDHPLVKEVDHA